MSNALQPGRGAVARLVRAGLGFTLIVVASMGVFQPASAEDARPVPTYAPPVSFDAAVSRQPALVANCGLLLCEGGRPWHMYGASEYRSSAETGIDQPAATVELARKAGLNTLRVINFYDSKLDPAVEPFSETRWAKVDAMIAAAERANMHVFLDLSDYRNILWKNCVNPYTSDWDSLIRFVAQRRNTVTGATYNVDPTIAAVSLAGEPERVGAHTFTAADGSTCTITYSTAELTAFFARTLSQWKATDPSVMVNSGGLGYIDWNSGIDWKTIFALPENDFCAIKTYGGMLEFTPTVATYCAGLGKPFIDEEFGWQQQDGDEARAADMTAALTLVRASGSAGETFWNLGNQVKPTSYDIGTVTPLAFDAVRGSAPQFGVSSAWFVRG